MAKRTKSIHLHLLDQKSAMTKEEIEHRKAVEASLNSGADKVRAPRWLRKDAKKEFNRLSKLLKEIKLVTNTDVDALAAYCNALCEYIECDRIVYEEGLLVEHTNKAGETNSVAHPLLVKKKAAFDIMYKVAGDFGFTPGARAKIALPKKDKQEPTEFEQKFGDV